MIFTFSHRGSENVFLTSSRRRLNVKTPEHYKLNKIDKMSTAPKRFKKSQNT